MKKGLKIAGISLGVILLILVLAPFLFKGKIISLAKEELNKKLMAKVDFKDISISAFKHFPKLAVSIDELSVVGKNEYEGDTLLSLKQFDAAINWWGAISGKNIQVYSINLNEPRIFAKVDANGKANWNIYQPTAANTSADTAQTNINIQLNQYAITNAYVYYKNEVTKQIFETKGLTHEGSGDFTLDKFELKTNTKSDELTFINNGIPYLYKVKTGVQINFQIDNAQKKYAYQTQEIYVNDLKIASQGSCQMNQDESMMLDVQFKSQNTSFKSVLSLIPDIYKNNFASVKTNGTAQVEGFVKGLYSKTQMPGFGLKANIDNAFFQYPDLPQPVSDIQLNIDVSNPDGVPDHTQINIPKAHFVIASDPFDFTLQVKTPVSNLWVNTAVKGKIDLSKVSQFTKLPNGTTLSGLLDANMQANGYVKALQQKQIEQFNASGTLGLNNFKYSSPTYPEGVALQAFLLTFNPKNVTLNQAVGSFKETNFSANGYLNNLIAYTLRGEPLEGNLALKADNFNVNDWMGLSADTAAKKTSTAAAFVVPANLNLGMNAVVDRVLYDNLEMKNVSGALTIAGETVDMKNVKANALDGIITLSGYYSTLKDKKNPDISFTYGLNNLDIQKTFNTFNTVQKLMPVGQYLAGKLSSQLTLTGKLGNNLMPDLASLNGVGNVLLLQGVLSKFQPLEKISQTLQLNAVKDITIKDLKSFFSFTNGRVQVKPFNLKSNGIDMEIGGSHGFDQTLDYVINMKVPRSLLGQQGNNVVNNLLSQATAKGVQLKVSDIIPLQVKLGGTIKNATVKTDLKQTANSLAQDMKQQAVDLVNHKIDSAKQAVTKAVTDTLKSVKNTAVNTVKNEIGNIISGNKKDSTKTDVKKKLEDAGKGLLKNLNPF